jgi:hypothetical protein
MTRMPEGQNISALLLGKTETLSYHLVQIRDRGNRGESILLHESRFTNHHGAARLETEGG